MFEELLNKILVKYGVTTEKHIALFKSSFNLAGYRAKEKILKNLDDDVFSPEEKKSLQREMGSIVESKLNFLEENGYEFNGSGRDRSWYFDQNGVSDSSGDYLHSLEDSIIDAYTHHAKLISANQPKYGF